MSSAKERIIKHLADVLIGLGVEDVEAHLEHPSDPLHGDYATNVALVAFGKSKVKSQKSKVQVKMQKWSNPLELAQDIKNRLAVNDQLLSVVDRVEVAPPGFINFWLSKEYLLHQLKDMVEEKELRLPSQTLLQPSQTLRGKKIMVEFTDPNPFKEFHVGHLFSNTVGESVCRLLESQGAIVKRANYFGDVGLHVAKAVYGLLKIFNFQFSIFNLEKKPLSERIKFLGQAYAEGSKAYEEDERAKGEIIAINKKIYEKDPDIMPLYEKGRAWSLAHFESIYQRLGTKFDYYYPESIVGSIGLNLVLQHIDDGIFVRSEGAIVFPGEQYGLHRRVFVNSLGLPTYEAKELGLAIRKYEEFPYDLSIVVTGNEIVEYFRVLLEAIKKVRPDLGEKTRHLPHGMVRLPMGKMSSRTGQVITAELLLDEAKQRMLSRFSQMSKETADAVAVGAVKYALLKGSPSKDVIYDINESIGLEGNSGPYLQYTFARTQSVLRRANFQFPISNFQTNFNFQNSNFKLEPEEIALLRTLHRFPEVVGEAAESFAPNILATYLFDLSQKFNLFYQKHPILSPGVPRENHPRGGSRLAPWEDLREFRLALTQAVGQTIKNGLHLLGIAAPERM